MRFVGFFYHFLILFRLNSDPADYDGVRMNAQVLCEQVIFIDNYPLSAFGNHGFFVLLHSDGIK